jgi:hypothetical protein
MHKIDLELDWKWQKIEVQLMKFSTEKAKKGAPQVKKLSIILSNQNMKTADSFTFGNMELESRYVY